MNFFDLIYPPSCIACQMLLRENKLFCNHCQEQLTLLSSQGHCVKCFSEIPMLSGTCKTCRKITHPFKKLSACFDSYGPGKRLLQTFIREKTTSLAKDLASMIVVQLTQLNYPSFAAVDIVPRGFRNPFIYVANEIARMLEVPFVKLLKKSYTTEKSFSVKKKCTIINKVVLLLDMEMQERKDIRSAAWALQELSPEIIYGMTFCATMH